MTYFDAYPYRVAWLLETTSWLMVVRWYDADVCGEPTCGFPWDDTRSER